MKNQAKTKEQLIDELVELRQRNAEIEKAEAQRRQADEAPHKLNVELDECVRERTEKLCAQIEEVDMTSVADDPLGKHVCRQIIRTHALIS